MRLLLKCLRKSCHSKSEKSLSKRFLRLIVKLYKDARPIFRPSILKSNKASLLILDNIDSISKLSSYSKYELRLELSKLKCLKSKSLFCSHLVQILLLLKPDKLSMAPIESIARHQESSARPQVI